MRKLNCHAILLTIRMNAVKLSHAVVAEQYSLRITLPREKITEVQEAALNTAGRARPSKQ